MTKIDQLTHLKPATGRKKIDLSHFSLTTRFILMYAGIGMLVRKHLRAQSYEHTINLDDVAPKIAAMLGRKRRNDDVVAHHPPF